MLIALADADVTPTAEDAFVQAMRNRRASLGLTQADLAKRVSDLGGALYQQTIAKIESGLRPLKIHEAELIATALKTTLRDMLPVKEASPPVPGEAISIALVETFYVSKVRVVEEARQKFEAASRRAQAAEEHMRSAQVAAADARMAFERAASTLAGETAERDRLHALIENHQPGLMYRHTKRGRGYVAFWPNQESDDKAISASDEALPQEQDDATVGGKRAEESEKE